MPAELCVCHTIGEFRVVGDVYHCSTCQRPVPDPDDETKPSLVRFADVPPSTGCGACGAGGGHYGSCPLERLRSRRGLEGRPAELVPPLLFGVPLPDFGPMVAAMTHQLCHALALPPPPAPPVPAMSPCGRCGHASRRAASGPDGLCARCCDQLDGLAKASRPVACVGDFVRVGGPVPIPCTVTFDDATQVLGVRPHAGPGWCACAYGSIEPEALKTPGLCGRCGLLERPDPCTCGVAHRAPCAPPPKAAPLGGPAAFYVAVQVAAEKGRAEP